MIVLTCSGTGGHVYPAIACAEQSSSPVHFIIDKGRITQTILDHYSFPVTQISMSHRHKLSFISAFKDCLSFFSNNRVTHVISFGGYATVPVVCAAFIKRIPITLCEQNAWPGRSNRILQFLAKKICISFDYSKRFFNPKKTVLTGNPIRIQFPEDTQAENLIRKSKPNHKHCLILGGSQGAQAINTFISEHRNWFKKHAIQCIHITGPLFFQENPGITSPHTIDDNNIIQVNYVQNMGILYDWADVVISRAGATTIAELFHYQKPALLIPYPYATNNHQHYNANEYQKAGLGVIATQDTLNSKTLENFFSDTPSQTLKTGPVCVKKILEVPN